MATFTFYANNSNNYDQNNYKHTSGILHQGYGADGHHHNDNQRAMVLFDSTAIRSALTGHTVQSCTLNWTVEDVEGTACVFFIGTHNYTALPNNATSSRMALDRVRYSFTQNQSGQPVTGVNIGATIGQEFKDGVTTGIMFGPAATNPTDNGADIADAYQSTQSRRPYIVITATPSNVPPDAPSLQAPASNAIGDLNGAGGVFTWTHNDPNGDPQVAFRFRRTKGGGNYDYWNGSAFVATETRIASSAQTVTIPAGVWGNNTAYSWSVRTEDAGGLIGPWAAERVVYASTPPAANVTAPTGNVTVARPTLRWTFSDPDGQPQYGWIAQVVPSEVYTQSGYDPSNYTSPTFSTSGTGTASSLVSTVDLTNHKTYRAYVRVSSSPLPTSALQFSNWAYSTFTIIVPPFAPSMVFPQNGGTADLAAGFTMDWSNSFYGPGSQTAFAIRRIVAGGSYQWWNGLAWESIERFLSGTQSQYAFRPGEISNGQTFTFSVAMRDDYNQTSPYSSGATVTGSAQAQVTIISPQDTAITTRPLVQWSEYDPENDPQQTYQVRIIAEATYTGQGTGWNPGTATAVWDTGELTDTQGGLVRSVVVSTDLTNGSFYRAYVRVKTGGVYSGWTYSEFQVSLVGPATPEMTAVVDSAGAAVVITIQGRDSFFTSAVAGNFSGWQAGFNSPTVTNQVFFASAHSSRISTMTATATGGMSARTVETFPVYPGQIYTAGATISMATGTPGGGQQANTAIQFLDAADTEITMVGGNIIVDDSAQRSWVTAAAPDNAVNARVYIRIGETTPVGAVHAWFDPVFRPGTGGEWSPGGLVGLTRVSVHDTDHDQPVRRGQQVPVPTTTQLVTVRDEEIHIGEAHNYDVTTSTVYPGGAVLTSVPGVVGPLTWTSGWIWLSDPLRPGTAHPFGPQSLGDIVRPIRQGKFRPLGRADAVITTGTRGLREGSFKLVTWTRDEREAFQDLVETSGVLLLRVPPDQGDPRGDTIFIRIQGDSPEARPLPHRTPHRTIEQAWVEQYRPLDQLEWDDEGS